MVRRRRAARRSPAGDRAWWLAVAALAVAAVAIVGLWVTRPTKLARWSEQLEVEVGRELAHAGVRSGRLVQETRTLARARGVPYHVVEKTYAVPPRFSTPAFIRDLTRQLPRHGFELQRTERAQTARGSATIIEMGVSRYRLYRLTLQDGAALDAGPPAAGLAPAPPGPLPIAARAKVAVVLDDWGYSQRLVPEVLKLNRPVTLAILPHQRYSTATDRAVRGSRCEVILHMPMEPWDDASPREPHVLTSGLSEEAVHRMLEAALATVPSARGVSNHQGSKATEDAALMRVVMQHLRARRLYFLDSLTAANSACLEAAREAGIPFAQRAVFLDNEETPEAIQRQVEALVAIARRAGWAVGIGHDKRVTLQVLQRAMPQYEREGIEFVALSAVEPMRL